MKKPATKIFTGSRIRHQRTRMGMTQSALALQLGISASYLNQIEHDVRPLPLPLLNALCDIFSVGVDYFSDTEEARGIQALREILADPVFDMGAVKLDSMQAAMRVAPDLCMQFVRLYRAYLLRHEQAAVPLVGHAPHPDTTTPDAPDRVEPYEAVNDWVQAQRNYFDEIDRTAERQAALMRLDEGSPREQLGRYLMDHHGIRTEIDLGLSQRGLMWHMDRRNRTLFLSRIAPSESSTFWMAQALGQIEHQAIFARIIRRSRLRESEARGLARVYLTNYFAGALLLPYERFRTSAHEVRHDLERLQRHFGVSFEQACQRLSTLQRPGSEGIPFYFLKTDIAGNILKSFSANRFTQSRFGGPCPLWNVFRAFTTPQQVQVQLSRTTDGALYLNVARTVGRDNISYLDRPRLAAVVLGCSIADAGHLVYSAGLDLNDPRMIIPIGPGCRACTRENCHHRALPMVGHRVDTDNEGRGIAPYRTAL
ncbi:helix-turn-helix transcriptional regulator [Komagataeibacter xylinus]|uniref:helix-turn-helix transcriptional regulator n=1 Tax=Komagataeibacter xylinus TaxID=28448 RepID=UPI001031F001|nr:helix-turn-helix transcriptional regulator [Komagataeibacter xylinus]